MSQILISMPSPPIPRSKSVPNIPDTEHSPSTEKHQSALELINSKIHSARYARSADSTSQPWPKKVFGDFITAARKPGRSPSKNLQLTEESLKEFNKQNEILNKYSTSSPYYKGLTDFSLDINRQKLQSTTPGREAYAASFISSSSTKTSLVGKVHEWGTSCFLFKGSARSKSPEGKPNATSSSSTRTEANVSTTTRSKAVATTTITTEIAEFEAEEVKVRFKERDDDTDLLTIKKPLGEKTSEPMPPPQPAFEPEPKPEQAPETSQASVKVSRESSSQTSSLLPIQQAQTQHISEKEMTSMEGNERKFVWSDKYRPSYLKDFLCNRSKALELQATIREREHCHHGHVIFEGQPGVGKRTMIWALLREVHGADNLQAREECKEFYLKGEAIGSIYVNVKVSAKHVEVNLSELRGYERQVIVQLINEKSKRSPQSSPENFKAIILYGADKLSSDALVYMRWLLERDKGCYKVFFCCSDASKLEPVKPICKLVQLLRPSVEEIVEVLEFIAEQERIELPHQLAVTIANNSKNNLRQAIRSFESTWHFNSSLNEEQEILTGWEDDIAHIARNIIEEQSPKQLYDIRGKLQNLIEHNVSPEFIFKMLVEEIKKNVEEELHEQIDKLYGKYNLQKNNEEHGKGDDDPVRKLVQQFMRIEEFIAKFMSWYKSLTEKKKGL